MLDRPVPLDSNPDNRPPAFALAMGETMPKRIALWKAWVPALLLGALICYLQGLFGPLPEVRHVETRQRIRYVHGQPRRTVIDTPEEQERARRRRELSDPTFIANAERAAEMPPPPPGTIRVAAVQFQPLFDWPEENREALEKWLRACKRLKARMVVVPELAVPGYGDPEHEVYWTREREAPADAVSAWKVAEERDGETVAFFAKLARELSLYITVPYIEAEGERLYNAVALVGPDGATLLHQRKNVLALLDRGWADPGEGYPTADTPLGRVGLAIGNDLLAFKAHREAKAELILHAAAFTEGEASIWDWVRTEYPRHVRRGGAPTALANWGMAWTPTWRGYGMSRVLDAEGRLLAARGPTEGVLLVIADIPRDGENPEEKKSQAQPKTARE